MKSRMKAYVCEYIGIGNCAGKRKSVTASNPLSACKKAFRVSGWHWETSGVWKFGSVPVHAKVYEGEKMVAECGLVDNG